MDKIKKPQLEILEIVANPVNLLKHRQLRRLRSNSSSSLPSTPEVSRKGRKREMSVCVESTVTQANSVDRLNKRSGRRGAICQEGSVSFFNRFFLMLNDRISLLSNRGIRAPRILNYMNSLNVSIEYPLSPFNDEPSRALVKF